MIALLLTLISLSILYLFLKWYFTKSKIRKSGLKFRHQSYPIIGSVPLLAKYTNHTDLGMIELIADGFDGLEEKIFAFDMGFGGHLVLIRDVDDILMVMNSSLRTPALLESITAALGFEGSFNLNGVRWHQHRKISVPALKKSTIREVSWIFEECCRALFDVIKHDGGVFHVSDLVEKFTFDVIGLLAFGTQFNALQNGHNEILESFRTAFSYFPKFLSNPLLKTWMKIKMPEDLERAQRVLEEQSKRIVEEKIGMLERNEVSERRDLTDILLSKLETIDTKGVMGEISLLLVAGSETTSNSISFLIYSLGMYPEVQEKLSTEISSVLGDRSITFEDIENLPYADLCVQEALRLSSVAGLLDRTLDQDLEIQGIKLKAGTDIVFSNHQLLRDHEVWGEDSYDFIPERFENLTENQQKSFLPFGAGKRICIGKTLAHTEMIWFIASLIQRFQIKPDELSEWPLPLKTTFTTTSKNEITVQLIERH